MDPTIEAVAMSTVPPDLPTCEDSPLTHESALPHQLSLLSPPKGLGNDFPSSTSSTSETISPISIPATPNSVSKELAPALNAQSGKGRVSSSNYCSRGLQPNR